MRPKNVVLLSVVVLLGFGWKLSGPVSAGPKILPPYTPANEKEALQFAEQHLPELCGVLARLKNIDQEQYQQAIREVAYESKLLARIKLKDERLHHLMLESWRTRSQIQLMAARIATAKEPDEQLNANLKKLLYRQNDLHRATIEHNRQRLLKSLKTMEANIKLLTEKREEIVERRYRAYIRKKPKPKSAPARKPQ